MEQSKVLSYISRPVVLFSFLLLLVIADRLNILLQFNFMYAGNDDLIFWQAANDYSKGLFYEPFFYGQNYNPMLEALLAVPLVWLKVPFNYALPIVSAAIVLFPFVFFACVLFRRNRIISSFIFLLVPLALPAEYGMITGMTRGFTSGLFFSSFLVLPVLYPERKNYWLLAAVSSGLALFFNLNAIVFIFPLMMFLWLHYRKAVGFYLHVMLGALTFWSLNYLAQRFYQLHPDHNIHPAWELEYSFSKTVENIARLDNFFSFLTPVIWPLGWLSLVFILVIGIYLIKKNQNAAISLLTGLLFIIACLGVNKVNDFLDPLLLSGTRMFLGLPLLFCTSLFWLLEYRVQNGQLYFQKIIPVLGVCFFFVKTGTIKATVGLHTVKTDYHAVAIKKVEDVKCECEKLNEIAEKEKAEIVVIIPNYIMQTALMEFYNYACPLLMADFPATILPSYEKRTWVYKSETKKVHRNIVVFGLDPSTIKSFDGIKVNSYDPPAYSLENNELPLAAALQRFNYTFRR